MSIEDTCLVLIFLVILLMLATKYVEKNSGKKLPTFIFIVPFVMIFLTGVYVLTSHVNNKNKNHNKAPIEKKIEHKEYKK